MAGTVHFGALIALTMLLFSCANHTPVHLGLSRGIPTIVVYMSGYMLQSLTVQLACESLEDEKY